jgi:hypothetical protein
MKSGVYLISNGQGHVKIGKFSGDPNRRLAQLQTGSACNLTLSAHKFYPNALKVEKSLHRQYRRLHIRGEWFKDSPEIALPEPRAPKVVPVMSASVPVMTPYKDRKPGLPAPVSAPDPLLQHYGHRYRKPELPAPVAAEPPVRALSAEDKILINVIRIVFAFLCVFAGYKLLGWYFLGTCGFIMMLGCVLAYLNRRGGIKLPVALPASRPGLQI